MNRSMPRLWWLGLIGLAWFAAPGEGQAWERPPLKVNTKFEFRVEVKVGPEVGRPTAPWYTYFPADARLMPSPQLSPYPPWPAQFPPAGQPFDALKGAKTQSRDTNGTPGPMLTQHQQWPNHFAYGSNLQPVGYAPMQAPSYWYQNR